jgi:hypothetical protein
MSSINPDILSTIFSFVPLEERARLGTISSEFAHTITNTTVSEKEKLALRKRRRAAFFDRHLDKIVWCAISTNSSIHPDFFRKHADKVDWKELSGNPAIPLDVLEDHLDELNFGLLQGNKSVPFEFFEKHSDRVGDWHHVAEVHDLRPELFEKFLDSKEICIRRNVPMEMLEEYRKRSVLDKFCYSQLSENESVPLEWLDQSQVNWNAVCWKRPLSLEWLEANLDKISTEPYGGGWAYLCRNERIPLEFFERHLDKVAWYFLGANENIPVSFFERHLGKYGMDGVNALTGNPNIPAEFFERHLRNKSDWEHILLNCRLSMDFLQRNLAHLNWSAISGNESVPIEFLEEHLDKLDWDNLCLGRKNIRDAFYVDRNEVGKVRVYRRMVCPTVNYQWPDQS